MPTPACLLLFLAALQGSDPPPALDERPSIQELREQLEARRLARRAELEPEVRALLGALAGLPSAVEQSQFDKLEARFTSLPAEAAPLLVPALDPGTTPTQTETRAAALVQRALLELGLRSITGELTAMARTGSLRGQALAVQLLGQSEDVLDASTSLLELWSSPPEYLGADIANALLQLDGEAHLPHLALALEKGAPNRVGWAVAALVEHQPVGTDRALSKFLSRTESAITHIGSLLEFYLQNPDSLGADEAEHMIGFLSQTGTPTAEDRAILEALPDLKRSTRGSWLSRLRDEEKLRNGQILELIRICLARSGERTARRNVLRESEGWVDRSKNSPEAYMERGRILLALRDYNRAASDFERAYELYKFPSKRRWAAGINQARALVLGEHLRQASTVLEDLNLTVVLKRQVVEDPDFEALREHPTYGRVLD